jgi:MFS family permease
VPSGVNAGPGEPGTGGGVSAAGLLAANRGFRSLCTARFLSSAGDALSLVALMVHVADSTGQALAVSVLLLVGDFTPSLFGPLTGAISDRFDLRRVMIGCELVQAALLVAIAVSLDHLPLVLVLVGLRALAGQVFLPASRAAIPALVADRDLPVANSTLGFGTNGAEAVGPLLAAALIPFAGVRGALLVDAATFAVSALLLATLRPIPPAPAAPALLAGARQGLRYIWSTPAVRVIAVGFCAVVACNGIDDVALVVLAKDTFQTGDAAVGILLAGVGIGLLAGYALLSRYSGRLAMAGLLVAGFAISSVGNLLTGLAWAVAAAFALQTVRGLGIAAMDVATNTLVQRLVPAGMLGRVFGNLYGGIGAAAALSYVAGGLLLDATSAPATFLIAGTAGTLATIAVAVRLPRALR